MRLSVGTPIKAVADGKIIYYGPRDGYGEVVAVIEHDLGKEYTFNFSSGDKKKVNTKYITSIYGHMRKYPVRDKSGNGTGRPLPWKAGIKVNKGDVIGYVDDDKHNGWGTPHLHMGIRLTASPGLKNGCISVMKIRQNIPNPRFGNLRPFPSS